MRKTQVNPQRGIAADENVFTGPFIPSIKSFIEVQINITLFMLLEDAEIGWNIFWYTPPQPSGRILLDSPYRSVLLSASTFGLSISLKHIFSYLNPYLKTFR